MLILPFEENSALTNEIHVWGKTRQMKENCKVNFKTQNGLNNI